MKPEEKQKTDPVVVDFKPQSKLRRLYNYHSLLIVIAILVVVGILTFVISGYEADHSSHVCTNSIVSEAVQSFNGSQLSKLKTVADEIEGLKSYRSDPNCMYIMTVYYTNAYDITSAQSSLNQLYRTMNAHQLNSLLTEYASIATLKSDIAYAKADLNQIAHNSLIASPKPFIPNTTKK